MSIPQKLSDAHTFLIEPIPGLSNPTNLDLWAEHQWLNSRSFPDKSWTFRRRDVIYVGEGNRLSGSEVTCALSSTEIELNQVAVARSIRFEFIRQLIPLFGVRLLLIRKKLDNSGWLRDTFLISLNPGSNSKRLAMQFTSFPGFRKTSLGSAWLYL